MTGIFKNFLSLKEENENLQQPHIISADPPIQLPRYIIKLADAFKNAKEIVIFRQVDPQGGEKEITLKNRKLYITGNIVAGYLINQPWNDFSIVTDAHPEESYKICQKIKLFKDLKQTPQGISFFVNGDKVEIKTMIAKFEKNKPVYTTEVYDDAKNGRNLFTLNSLYYDIVAEKIIDPLGGINDLRKKQIRFYNDEKEIVGNVINLIKFCVVASKINDPKITQEDRNFANYIPTNEDNITPRKNINNAFLEGLKCYDNDKINYFKYLKEMGLNNQIFNELEVSDINQKMKGNFPPSMFIASALINNDTYKIYKTLNNLEFDKNIIRDVVFLVNMKSNRQYSQHMTFLTERQVKTWIDANL